MPYIVLESGKVLNLGGYVIENVAKLPYRDVVVGNPLREPVKIQAPVYSAETLGEYKKQGLVVEFLKEKEMLREVLDRVSQEVRRRQQGW